jgi:hypothetical protein
MEQEWEKMILLLPLFGGFASMFKPNLLSAKQRKKKASRMEKVTGFVPMP